MNNTFSLILKYLFPFTCRVLGVYIALFFMCFYAHVNESNIIANRADALLTEIAHGEKTSLVKVVSVQNMGRKARPSILEPYTIYNSLFGKRESYKAINIKLGDAIENHKDKLAGLGLGRVYLEGADLSKADMHGADLSQANLSGTVLRGANLIAAKFKLADLHGANFLNANVYRADFRDTILNGADLSHAVGITCDQIKSAIIDENTRLPDYISMGGPAKSVFKCVSLLEGGGMDLRGMNLENVYLQSANFSESNLSQVNFQNAKLPNKLKFNNSNLSKANLRGATLKMAVFIGANLTGADLRGANLWGADLRGANLNRAIGITCEQIESAVIDENTVLPDYISLDGSPGSNYKCENTLNKN